MLFTNKSGQCATSCTPKAPKQFQVPEKKQLKYLDLLTGIGWVLPFGKLLSRDGSVGPVSRYQEYFTEIP